MSKTGGCGNGEGYCHHPRVREEGLNQGSGSAVRELEMDGGHVWGCGNHPVLSFPFGQLAGQRDAPGWVHSR